MSNICKKILQVFYLKWQMLVDVYLHSPKRWGISAWSYFYFKTLPFWSLCLYSIESVEYLVVTDAEIRLLVFTSQLFHSNYESWGNFDCVDHNRLWKSLKEMGILYLTCLLRNMYAGQEATGRTGHGTTDWFQIGKARLDIVTLLI